jgi:hypothetical protein
MTRVLSKSLLVELIDVLIFMPISNSRMKVPLSNRGCEIHAPKRRFWNVEPAFQSAFSKRFSTFCSPIWEGQIELRSFVRYMVTWCIISDSSRGCIKYYISLIALCSILKAEETVRNVLSTHVSAFCRSNTVDSL